MHIRVYSATFGDTAILLQPYAIDLLGLET